MILRWNWGTKIALVYSAFVVFMLGMVYMCTRQHFDLVAPDYYAQELRFQEVIDGKNNADALSASLHVKRGAQSIEVQVPTDGQFESGQLRFYRPNDARLDLLLPIGRGGLVVLDAARVKKGNYKIIARWQAGGKPFYAETNWIAP
jgi:hypothetical protein